MFSAESGLLLHPTRANATNKTMSGFIRENCVIVFTLKTKLATRSWLPVKDVVTRIVGRSSTNHPTIQLFIYTRNDNATDKEALCKNEQQQWQNQCHQRTGLNQSRIRPINTIECTQRYQYRPRIAIGRKIN